MLAEDQQSIFLNWLQQHSAAVIKVARAYTLNQEECQDLAQEILLQAWRSLPRFSGKSTPATWFYRVALHTAMNWHRHDRPRRLFQQPLLESHTISAQATEGVIQAEQREVLERLYQAIAKLPSMDAALVLLHLEELSYREMADVLGISESHVGVKLNRVKKVLNTLMSGAHDE